MCVGGGKGGGWGGHNKVTFGASCNFIGKMGGWKLGGGVQILSIERGVLWNKMTLCVFFFFCLYRCEGVFFHAEKSNVGKHSFTYRILL